MVTLKPLTVLVTFRRMESHWRLYLVNPVENIIASLCPFSDKRSKTLLLHLLSKDNVQSTTNGFARGLTFRKQEEESGKKTDCSTSPTI